MTEVRKSQIGRRRAAAKELKSAIYADRRPEIVRAAANLFKQRGVSRTTVADIADSIGADRATIYYYFESKEEIHDAVVREGVDRTIAILERARSSDADALTKLREMVVDLMVSCAQHYPFLYVYLQDHLDHVAPKRQEWAERMRSINRRGEQAVEDIIRQGIEEGSIDPLATPRVLAFGALGIVCWTNRWFDPATSPVDAREIGEAYAEIIVKGLRKV